jgi:hypothetical protein
MILIWFWTAIHTKSMKTLLGSHLWCILEGSYNNLISSLLGNGDGKGVQENDSTQGLHFIWSSWPDVGRKHNIKQFNSMINSKLNLDYVTVERLTTIAKTRPFSALLPVYPLAPR